MRSIGLAFTALTLGVASAGAQDIFVRDFGSAEISYANGATPKIRRGMTSHVRIVKDFIDLVRFEDISVTGTGVTIGSLSNGRTNNGNGTGFLSMDVTVPSGFNTGSDITLNVGLGDRFNLRVVHPWAGVWDYGGPPAFHHSSWDALDSDGERDGPRKPYSGSW